MRQPTSPDDAHAYDLLVEEQEKEGYHLEYARWQTTQDDAPQRALPQNFTAPPLFKDYGFDPHTMSHKDCLTLASAFVQDSAGTPDELPSVVFWIQLMVDHLQEEVA